MGFSLAVYLSLSLYLHAEIDRAVRLKAEEVERALGPELRPAEEPRQVLTSESLAPPGTDVFAAPEAFAQILDLDGSVLASTANLLRADLPHPSMHIEAAARGEDRIDTVSGERRGFRILVRPLLHDGEVIAVLQVAVATEEMERTLTRLALLLLAVSVVTLGIAEGGAAFLARKALQPIDEMVGTARSIAQSEDLARRLPAADRSDDLGRLARTVNGMLERIEALFRLQEGFTAAASHQLRTPLTILQGNLDLLLRGAAADGAARRQIVDDMQGEVERMQRLVSDLLLLARTRAGLDVRWEEVELSGLLAELHRQAAQLASRQEVRLVAAGPVWVKGDPERIRQLVLNLVENALAVTKPGDQLTLGCRRENDEVHITVEDTGPGIASEHLSLIFEPFYRIRREPDGREGAGLGLTIAREIARAHGGDIRASSELGRGSLFTVVLPALIW